MQTRRIFLIGLGNLGLPIALRLLDVGFRVAVSDLDLSRLRPALDAGAESWASEARAAAGDAVMVVVPADAAVFDLLDRGLLARLQPGSLLIVHSTILPATARQLAAQCRDRGIAFLDAPVSGGAERARAGTLTAMVGGTEAEVSAARPLIAAVATEIVTVGPAGAGSTAKLANQLMVFAALSGAYEALRFATASGLSESDVLAAVATGTGASWVSEHWGFYDELADAYDQAQVPAESRPWHKDLKEFAAAAAEIGVPSALADFLATSLPAQVAEHAQAMRAVAIGGGR